METNKVKSIRGFDQNIWLDYFDRRIMNNGKLQKLIEDDGIGGITSNPSIFEKAIMSSKDYDDDIRILSRQEKSNENIFFSLAITDIKRAADILIPLYNSTKGADGFVSLEVSPHLASDMDGTVKQARHLWNSIGRKNSMIKIPATLEGIPAIRKCISEGININVTLLFGLQRYEDLIEAYISGLEDRAKANLPIDHITSVASFFLSRIDVLIDPILEEKGLDKLKGEVAISSAKKAYQIYKNSFQRRRFKKLEEKGAKPQKVLWASTSSKNPSFSDVKYVEALIGANTINTLPIETIEAFRHHGSAGSRLESNLPQADQVLLQLKANGIDLDDLTQHLEEEGIRKFNKAYDALLGTIETKKEKLCVDVHHFETMTLLHHNEIQ